MSINELAQEIMREAKEEAAAIDLETRERLSEIQQETQRILQEKRLEMINAVKKQEEEERKRQEAKITQQIRIKELELRRELIGNAFKKARERLRDMEGSERKGLLEHLWKSCKQHISPKTVIVASKDKPFFSKRCKVEDTVEGLGGFIAIDGDTQIDYRFETLLEQVESESITEIASLLFGERRDG